MLFTTDEWKQAKEICKDRASHYNRFFIEKKSGKKREILAPDAVLKGLQKKLLNEFIYVHFIPSVYATGFIVDRSIVDNATAHVGAKILVNVDVKDFFPSITADMICEAVFVKKLKKLAETKNKKNFIKKTGKPEWEVKPEDYELKKKQLGALVEKAELLTKLVTYPYRRKDKIVDALPQGAPTSPALSNVVCFEMDNVLSGVAKRNDAAYTRYADDLSFSSSVNTRLNKVIPVIKDILEKYDFRANERKIHVNRRSGRMSVTGLVVNDKVSYGRGRLRILRVILHNAKMKVKDGKIPPFDEMHFRGLAAYINSFDPGKAIKMNAEINQIVDGINELKGR